MGSRLVIVSDIHYPCTAERARVDFEVRTIQQPLVRCLVRLYRRYIWLRDPLGHAPLLDDVLLAAERAQPDLVIANGDYSCDTAFVGVSDEAAFQSAEEVLGRWRAKFNGQFLATIGDHELGKVSLAGGAGGMMWRSWQRSVGELSLEPFWTRRMGRFVLVGVTSSLIAYPVLEPETEESERENWVRAREEHLAEIRNCFGSLKADDRVILFCHDPTALPFLGREEAIRARLDQLANTVIGHLHSRFVLRQSRMLSGLPTIRFLGSAIRRMSQGLGEVKHWKPFRVEFCPALTGIQLFKDGGYLTAEVDQELATVKFKRHRLRWR